ncbi:MAG: hypothetical protein AAFV69_09695 [Pseudomonadota bacterium]
MRTLIVYTMVVVYLSTLGPLPKRTAEASMPEPYLIVRSLTVLQNAIAQGVFQSPEAQRDLVSRIGSALLQTKPSVWKDNRKNTRAAIKYVLSGGNPQILKHLLERDLIQEDYLQLAQASLAYGEGRKQAASVLLSKVEPRDLVPSLAGHVALVKALMIGSRQPSKVHALLDDARLLSPGTIVEEAALRRQIEFATSRNEIDAMLSLSSRYLRRFASSRYADGMIGRLADSFARVDYGGDGHREKIMDLLMSTINLNQKRKVLGVVAQNALAYGHLKTIDYAVELYKKLPDDLVSKTDRMKLYEGASLIVSDGFDAGVALIESVDRSRLHKTDRELATAAMQLVNNIRRQPKSSAIASSTKIPESDSEGPFWPEIEEARKVVASGQKLDAKLSALLGSIKP